MNSSVFASDETKEQSTPELFGIALSFLVAACAEILFQNNFNSTELVIGISRAVLVFLIFITIHRFSLATFKFYKPKNKDLFCLFFVLLLTLTVIYFSRHFIYALAKYSETFTIIPSLPLSALLYAIPFAFGGLLIQSVLGLHYGLIFSLFLSVIVAVYFRGSASLALFALLSNLVAVLSLRRIRSRSAYLKSAVQIAILIIPFAFSSCLAEGIFNYTECIYRILSAVFGCFIAILLAAAFTPLLEYLGGYVTDIRLIEMATLDHPLLKELSVQAPGTWNHSMVMGMMVEAAAIEVGSNPILSRVGAYFHDIGKMKKPLYFVENQIPGENRHDKLSTSMSALIIRSHVKDGLELGKQYKLPESILAMIAEHHGTSVIEYFYEKAVKEAEEEDPEQEVDISLYTYPGPKPQSRESGILMLADGIEAAARTLKDPSIDKIQGLVQKMINKVFASGELNECDLTLNDLHKIAKCFTKVLTGIYHQRIAYAEPAEKTENTPAKTLKFKAEDLEKKSTGAENGEKKENLKRLGL